MVSGVDDDATLHANREGYKHVRLRPRRLRDATKVDMRVELFGSVYNSPIFRCPVSGHKAFSPGNEWDAARTAKARGTLQFLSLATSTAVEDVNKELGRPVWQQFYAPSAWDVCEQILRRIEAAGCSVIALTVDTGHRKIGLLYTVPKSSTRISTLVASRRRRGRNCTCLYPSRLAWSVASSDTAHHVSPMAGHDPAVSGFLEIENVQGLSRAGNGRRNPAGYLGPRHLAGETQ